jgi:TonB family protein
MFEFVISGNQKRRPAKRIIAAGVTSCLAHIILLCLLLEYPQLLQGGVYHRFRTIWQPQTDDGDQNWRTVTVISKMTMPSAATLKKLLSDSGKKKREGPPPIHIRLGKDLNAVLSNKPAMPKIQQENKNPSSPSLPANESDSAGAPSTIAETLKPGTTAGNSGDANAGKQDTAILPPSGSESRPVPAANNVAPSKIPDSIKPPVAAADPASSGTDKAHDVESKTIRSPENGIFDPNDTKGFPMGDYTNRIVELIKEKWFIPSYLKDSQGHTTVVFYIDKNGRAMNVRIVTGSGSNSLDIAALNAVLSCNLPALPKGFPGDRVGARFVFSYNEHQ